MTRIGIAVLLACVLSTAHAQTMVTKTIMTDPVTTYADGTPIEAAIVVNYTLEHRYCGATTWDVKATALTVPSSVRSLEPACHEYVYLAYSTLTDLLPSDPSPVLRIDLTPPPAPKKLSAPQNIRAQ